MRRDLEKDVPRDLWWTCAARLSIYNDSGRDLLVLVRSLVLLQLELLSIYNCYPYRIVIHVELLSI